MVPRAKPFTAAELLALSTMTGQPDAFTADDASDHADEIASRRYQVRPAKLGHRVPVAGTLDEISYCHACGAGYTSTERCTGQRVNDPDESTSNEQGQLTGA